MYDARKITNPLHTDYPRVRNVQIVIDPRKLTEALLRDSRFHGPVEPI